MSNKNNKPKQTSAQIISKMKNNGVTFKYITEVQAAEYLTDRNNYLRTASYRKNYQKYNNGANKGKYICLDFSYLQELSTIDMHFRFLISKMCLDIEHDLKVKLLKDIEIDPTTDGYDIVELFLRQNPYIIEKIESTSTSPFTCDLIQKYFTINTIYNSIKQKTKNRICAFDDCPIWVLFELISFGDFIKFYEFYYSSRKSHSPLPMSIVNLVKSLRNGVAHNNCILMNLSYGGSRPPKELNSFVISIPDISKSQRQKKLSCRPILEFTALLYTYDQIVSKEVKYYRAKELKELFFNRFLINENFFSNNELIKSTYHFACKLIQAIF